MNEEFVATGLLTSVASSPSSSRHQLAGHSAFPLSLQFSGLTRLRPLRKEQPSPLHLSSKFHVTSSAEPSPPAGGTHLLCAFTRPLMVLSLYLEDYVDNRSYSHTL